MFSLNISERKSAIRTSLTCLGKISQNKFSTFTLKKDFFSKQVKQVEKSANATSRISLNKLEFSAF